MPLNDLLLLSRQTQLEFNFEARDSHLLCPGRPHSPRSLHDAPGPLDLLDCYPNHPPSKSSKNSFSHWAHVTEPAQWPPLHHIPRLLTQLPPKASPPPLRAWSLQYRRLRRHPLRAIRRHLCPRRTASPPHCS